MSESGARAASSDAAAAVNACAVRRFHDVRLGHGSLPLATLRRELPGWFATGAG